MMTFPWLRIPFSFSEYFLLASSRVMMSILSDLPSYSAKAHALIDWEPEYSLTTGVKEMLAYYWT
jgi:hypothetical protein